MSLQNKKDIQETSLTESHTLAELQYRTKIQPEWFRTLEHQTGYNTHNHGMEQLHVPVLLLKRLVEPISKAMQVIKYNPPKEKTHLPAFYKHSDFPLK